MLGDEEEFINKIKQRIKAQAMKFSPENYLIILGYEIMKSEKRVILFKGFFLDEEEEIVEQKQRTVLQAE
ncbi:MAG: hypothetical protein ACUVTD_04245 [Nitrososphaerales archaeon]